MQITKHIHALKIPFEVTGPSGQKLPRFVYVYLICGERICLIDSGVASSERIIADYLQRMGRSPEEITQLILTHAHPDHIGSAAALKGMSGCAVAAHAAERAWIEDVDLQGRERPIPGFKSLVGGSVSVDLLIEDGDALDLGGGLCLQVLHTPGHSPGSLSLWLPQERALFSADAVPVPGDMPIYEDLMASVRSIKRLKSVAGVGVLLAAWDEPRAGAKALLAMEEALSYLQRIHRAVLLIADQVAGLDGMELCRRVLRELGLPETMANPITARSFLASLEAREAKDLSQD